MEESNKLTIISCSLLALVVTTPSAFALFTLKNNTKHTLTFTCSPDCKPKTFSLQPNQTINLDGKGSFGAWSIRINVATSDKSMPFPYNTKGFSLGSITWEGSPQGKTYCEVAEYSLNSDALLGSTTPTTAAGEPCKLNEYSKGYTYKDGASSAEVSAITSSINPPTPNN